MLNEGDVDPYKRLERLLERYHRFMEELESLPEDKRIGSKPASKLNSIAYSLREINLTGEDLLDLECLNHRNKRKY
jgi:hypothetical protein|tara:strand:- start:397 stop:624 length:228 start_codon:yes stop_codon:yes gene_type:complete